jgi:flagellar biosynthetic protein FliR
LIAIFLTNLSLALLARIAPQTNIFILSFTMKVVVGIVVLTGTVPLFVLVIKNSLSTLESDLMDILISLNQVGI